MCSRVRVLLVVVQGAEIPNPVDQDGRFTLPVSDFAGQYVKDADKAIISAVKVGGRSAPLTPSPEL